ncbi:MAG TPA: ABC transporter permease [Anaerolineales bacterium]|nr:ABC transporter permease [Anaerolineales bacterium]
MTLQTLKQNLRVAYAAFVITLRMNAPDAFVLFTIVVQPLVIAVMAMWMLVERGAANALYVVVGSGMTGLWSTLLFMGGNSINWERWTGTLELMVGQPTPVSVIVFGKNAAVVFQSLLSMVGSYSVAAILFRQSLVVEQPLLFAVSLILTTAAFVCFGLVIAPMFLLSPAVQHFQNALEFPVYMLCGFLFPIALLPGWTTPLSYLLAPYWAARALHGTSTGGASLQETLFAWGMMLLLGLIYLLISGWLTERMLYKARSEASLRLE